MMMDIMTYNDRYEELEKKVPRVKRGKSNGKLALLAEQDSAKFISSSNSFWTFSQIF